MQIATSRIAGRDTGAILARFERSIYGLDLASKVGGDLGLAGRYAAFNRYYFAQKDKQGAVIDERFNSGGLEVALGLLATNPVELKPQAPDPVRVRRPE